MGHIRTAIAVALLSVSVAAAPPATTRAATPATTQATTQRQPDVRVVRTTIDIKPSLITGDLSNATPARVFGEIAAQSGMTFTESPRGLLANGVTGKILLTAQFDKEPFWTAVAEACDPTNLIVETDSQSSAEHPSMRVSRGDASSRRVPSCVDGVVRFNVMNSRLEAFRAFADPASRRRRLVFVLTAIFEPKIAGPVMLRDIKLSQAVDDKKNSLIVDQPVDRMAHWPLGQTIQLPITLDADKSTGSSIAVLEGEVEFDVPREIVAVTAVDVVNGAKEISIADNKLKIYPIRRDGNRSSALETLLSRGANISDAQWELLARAAMDSRGVLTAGDGSRMSTGGGSDGGPETVHQRLVLSAANLTEAQLNALKFHIELPAAMQTLKAKFSFKDLPLPEGRQ